MKSTSSPAMLETERLYLRELNPEIYAQLLTSRSDSELMAYFGFQAKEALEEEKERFRQGFVTYFISFHNFHLLDKKTEQVIGKCGFHTWIPTHRRAEVGYQLFHDQHKGKGLMTEALGAVLSYGFEQMNLYRVEAFIADYNVPSHRLLQHSGFSEEGVVRGHYIVDGVNEDSLLLSLLRPEYEKLKASLFAQGEQV